MDKIFGKIVQQGGCLIPQDKIAQLIAYKHLLSAGQNKDILNAFQSGGQLIVKPTRTQQGGFLGTLQASIGVPLLLNALTGKGLQADRTGTSNTMSVYVPGDTTSGHGMINPYAYMSPPVFRTWENPVGMGVKKKKKKRTGIAAWQKQSIQFTNTIKFINKPSSNIDLLHWVKQLVLKYFRGIYSRDILPERIHRLETGIINLHNSIGRDSHWVYYRNVDKQFCEYFDPFGIIIPYEIKNYLKTSGKKTVYSSDEIQERDSVLCG